MLFSAGTGSGLMFFGVAEPVLHYANPPTGQANTAVAAKEGMRITLPSSIGARRGDVYAALGRALAYSTSVVMCRWASSRRGSRFVGKRISTLIGTADVLTLLGVAALVGMGRSRWPLSRGGPSARGWPAIQRGRVYQDAANR